MPSGQENSSGAENMSGVTELGTLPRVFRGYAPDPVDELVRSVTVACDRARKEIRELSEQARRLDAELQEVMRPERELRETFVLAQREAEELRSHAAREADAIRALSRGIGLREVDSVVVGFTRAAVEWNCR